MKKSNLLKMIAVFLLITSVLHAQQSNNNFSDFWQDFASTSNRAFSSDNYENWKLFSFVGLTSIFIFGSDIEMHEEFGIEKERGPMGLTRRMGKIGEFYDKPGPIYFTLGLAGSLYSAGNFLDNSKMIETTNMMMQSVLYTGIITSALKVLIGRSRPYVKNKPLHFRPFNTAINSKYMSMPSGHTSSIFAMMTVIAKQYDSWYIKLPAYTFATSVAFQRINDKQHWLSDILVGGTLGYLIADAIVNKKGFTKDFSIRPLINSSGLGLSIKF